MPPGGAGFGSAALAQSPQKRRGIVQERPRQGHVIQVRVRDWPDRETIEAVDGRAGEREQDGRVRRRSEEHTSELQSQSNLVCRLLLEKKNLGPCRIRPNTRGPHTWPD